MIESFYSLLGGWNQEEIHKAAIASLLPEQHSREIQRIAPETLQEGTEEFFKERKNSLRERICVLPGKYSLLVELGATKLNKDLDSLARQVSVREGLLQHATGDDDVLKHVAANALYLLQGRWDNPRAENVILSAVRMDHPLPESARKFLEAKHALAESLKKGLPGSMRQEYETLAEELKALSKPKEDIRLSEFFSDLEFRANRADRDVKLFLRQIPIPAAEIAPEPEFLETIPIERFEAFGLNAEIIHGVVMRELPRMISAAKASGKTEKIRPLDLYGVDLKCRVVQGQPQIIVSEFLGIGTFKVVQKVLLVAGPSLSCLGHLFAYAKLKPSFRKVPQRALDLEIEIQISKFLNKHTGPERPSNIIHYHKVVHKKGGALLKGIQMEFCEMNAEEVIKNIREYPLETRLTIVRDIANGLSLMHANELCHLDFKPGNVLIKRTASRKLSAYISDFGTTGRIGSRDLNGTRCYQEPAVLAALQTAADVKIDAWSFGLVFFELMKGVYENPFFYMRSMKDSEVLKEDFRDTSGRWYSKYKELMAKLPTVSPPSWIWISGLLDLNRTRRLSVTEVRSGLDVYLKTI